MDAKQKIGGRRSKRLILKRNNENIKNDGICSDQSLDDAPYKKGCDNSDLINFEKKGPTHEQDSKNESRKICRRGRWKTKSNSTMPNSLQIQTHKEENFRPLLSSDKIIRNNDNENESNPSNVEELTNSTNNLNFSDAINDAQLDFPSTTIESSGPFDVKSEIEVEENFTEVASETTTKENEGSPKNGHHSTNTYSNCTDCTQVRSPMHYSPDLGTIIRADHDYIDLLVDAIKKEPVDEDEIQGRRNTNYDQLKLPCVVKTEPMSNLSGFDYPSTNAGVKDMVKVKTEPEEVEEEEVHLSDEELYIDSQIIENRTVEPIEIVGSIDSRELSTVGQYEQNSNLSTLAEVSLATAGKFYEPQLNHQINQARANLYPSERHRNVNSKYNETSLINSGQNLLSPNIPTIDLPQSVKDAIIASATSSKTASYTQNIYDAQGFNYRNTQVPSIFPKNAHPPHHVTSCNNSRPASIELSHTANRRMQITLPENTTHIVICTSGRGNNSKQLGNVSNNNSVTLDINADSGVDDTCCNRTNLLGMKDCSCKNIDQRHDQGIVKEGKVRVNTNTSHLNFATNLIQHVVGSAEKDVANLCKNNEEDAIDPSETDDFCIDGSKRAHYNCAECGKSYSTSSNLARHRQTHRSLDDTKAKKCPYCSKIYVSMPAFSMHMRTHNQNCKCNFCGKTFSRPWLLQGHLRTHTGERPYTCQICSKAFADKSNLRAHVQTHSSNKPYRCKHCGKTFALKSYLYKHEEAACLKNVL